VGGLNLLPELPIREPASIYIRDCRMIALAEKQQVDEGMRVRHSFIMAVAHHKLRMPVLL
jgi:hypothetical protein